MLNNLLIKMKKQNEEIFLFKPCKTSIAFQSTLKKGTLDLHKCESALRKAGYSIELSTKSLIVAKSKLSVSIFPSGRILVKDTTDEDEAKKIIEKIYSLCLK
jgi:TATA-box binding protein (TBP) (component of TFIID and TFIIIB)